MKTDNELADEVAALAEAVQVLLASRTPMVVKAALCALVAHALGKQASVIARGPALE